MSRKTRDLYRRADNGQITNKGYADRHPSTTVKERIKLR